MDFITILIFASIVASTLLMIVGPIREFRGKFVLLENNRLPQTSRRYGMWIMAIAAALFFGGCVSRQWVESRVIDIVVTGAYVLWFIGGFVSLVRNEMIKALVNNSEDKI